MLKCEITDEVVKTVPLIPGLPSGYFNFAKFDTEKGRMIGVVFLSPMGKLGVLSLTDVFATEMLLRGTQEQILKELENPYNHFIIEFPDWLNG